MHMKMENTASKPIRKPEYANVKLLAFTFDDAPSFSGIGDNATTQIIDALSKYGGVGTMFVNGKILMKTVLDCWNML